MLKIKKRKGTEMKDKTKISKIVVLKTFLHSILKTSLFLFLIGIILTSVSVDAQEKKQEVLTLERIYKDNDFSLKRFGPTRWLEDGSGYSTLEKLQEFTDAKNIIKYNPKTGDQYILVDASQLIPKGEQSPLLISDYHWSADGQKLLIFTNSVRVWRYETRGDYWVLDLVSEELFQLGNFTEPSTMMFAKFSPDGSKAGYVVKNNIYVEDLKTSEVVQLTHDGSSRIINGTFDWVYEEELDCRDGFRWSPDGRHIAYWQSDTKGTGAYGFYTQFK